jgi:hypothetical protein
MLTAGNAGTAGSSGGATAGNAGVGAGGSAGFGPGTIAVSNLEIEENPNMTISCFVSWTTAEPATSEVQFGEGGYEFRIFDDTLVTDHRVLVIGMHASTAYQIKAVSGNSVGTGSAEGMFTTGMLPSNMPAGMVTMGDASATYAGWTLTNLQASLSAPARVVMYDQNGEVVWYYIHGTAGDSRGDVSTELIGDTVLVGPTSGTPARLVDLSGEVIWEGPANSQSTLMSHFAMRAASGNYFLNREIDKAVMNGSTRIDDQRIEEITTDLDVVWSWNLFDHVPPSGTKEELCHANHLLIDEENGILHYNCRWVGLFKIDRASGEILWRMGGSYDETSLGPGDFTFVPPESQFSDAHEPDLKADGTLLLYDNGGFGMGGGGNFHSRVVQYQVDETNMTATRTWEFPGTFNVDSWYTNTWYTPYWGDADRLPNGNVLVTAGLRSASNASRFFEVTNEGEVVWELVLPTNIGVYKAARLAPPPLVEAFAP